MAIAALMVWKLTVSIAITMDIKPVMANTHQSTPTLYEKICSQLCMAHQAIGVAMINEIITSFCGALQGCAVMIQVVVSFGTIGMDKL